MSWLTFLDCGSNISVIFKAIAAVFWSALFLSQSGISSALQYSCHNCYCVDSSGLLDGVAKASYTDLKNTFLLFLPFHNPTLTCWEELGAAPLLSFMWTEDKRQGLTCQSSQCSSGRATASQLQGWNEYEAEIYLIGLAAPMGRKRDVTSALWVQSGNVP